ncbi:hypothetical protein D3C71_1844140 [compost metagenome]
MAQANVVQLLVIELSQQAPGPCPLHASTGSREQAGHQLESAKALGLWERDIE